MDVPKWRLFIARRNRPHVSLVSAVFFFFGRNEMAVQGFDYYWQLDYATFRSFLPRVKLLMTYLRKEVLLTCTNNNRISVSRHGRNGA